MLNPIVRGRFSHNARDDVSALTYPFRLKQSLNKVEMYENEMSSYVGSSHCVSFGFARTAFWAVLKSLSLPNNSKIILPSITIKAMLDVVLHLGHVPLFVDTDPKTGCVDLDSLEELLKENPRVILLTYLFGVVPNVEEIVGTIRKSSVFIVEDFSQCLNGEFKSQKVGTFGDVSILSTSAVKTLDTYGGGLLFTNDEMIHRKLRQIRSSLREQTPLEYYRRVLTSLIKNLLTGRSFFPFIAPIIFVLARVKSRHFTHFVGSRSKEPITALPEEWFVRLSKWQAACGLKYLNRVKINDAARTSIAKRYSVEFSFIGSKFRDFTFSTFWQCIVLDDNPKIIRAKLASLGIDSAQTSLILLSELPAYGWDLSEKNKGAKVIYSKGVYIPLYHQLKEKEITRILKALSKT
jgi:dTDP-4-amino-4,6-dideoxygalactose transaminase